MTNKDLLEMWTSQNSLVPYKSRLQKDTPNLYYYELPHPVSHQGNINDLIGETLFGHNIINVSSAIAHEYIFVFFNP